MTSDRAVRWTAAVAARFRRRPVPRIALPSWNHVLAVVAIPVGTVAAVAGVVSYSHITALGLRTYQGQADAHLLAVPIDGLIVAGSVLLAAGSALGWLGVTLGVAATLFANLQFGLPHGALSAATSTWPAVSFSVAMFMLERWLRSRRRQGSAGAPWTPVPADAQSAAEMALRATLAAGNPLSGRQLETRFGLSRSEATTLRRVVLASANGAGDDPPDE
jgi:hypothetical protein